MAEAVAAALWEAGAAWAAEAAIAVAANAGWINAALALTASTAYSSYQERKARAAARAGYVASLKDRELMIRSGVAPRRWIYGRDRVSGPIVYAESTGDKQQYLHLVIALAAHECEAIEQVWFGDDLVDSPQPDGFVATGKFAKRVTHQSDAELPVSGGIVTLPITPSRVLGVATVPVHDSGSDPVSFTHTPGSNQVSVSGLHASVQVSYEYQTVAKLVRIRRHLGQAGQVADPDLVAESAGKWTAAHKGVGICYLYVRLEWDADIFGAIGVPDIRCVVKGRKVLDPRLAQDVWTDNAALIARDWCRRPEGMGAGATEVRADEVIAAANICDEVIDLNQAGTITQRRYTFNGSVTADQSPAAALSDITQAMAGRHVWVQGRWLLAPGAYGAPGDPITESHLADGTITITPKASRSGLCNAVRAIYRDPDQNWAEVQAPLVTNAMYQAEDGGVQMVRTIQLQSAMDAWRAQRMAKIELERSRQAVTVSLGTNLRAYDHRPTGIAPLSLARYGWSGKGFEVIRRALQLDGTIQYTLRESAPGVFAWNYGEATTVDLAPDTDLPNPHTPPAVVDGLTAASGTAHLLRLADGTIISRVQVSWTPSVDQFVVAGGSIQVQWRVVGSADWQSVPPTAGDLAVAYISPSPDRQVITIRARQVNAIGRASEWTSITHRAQGKSAPPSDVIDFALGVTNGLGTGSWARPDDLDYSHTEVRAADADWGSDTVPPLFRGDATQHQRTVTTTGSITWYARHVDTSGNFSVNVASASHNVGTGDLPGTGGTAAPVYQALADPPNIYLVADSTGHVSSYTGAWMDLRVFDVSGGAEVTGYSWTLSGVPSGVTASVSTNRVTVTAVPDAGIAHVWSAVGVKSGEPTMRITVSTVKRYNALPGQFVQLSKWLIELEADAAGHVADYTGATTSVSVLEDGVPATGYSWSVVAPSGLTGTISGNVYTVTGMPDDMAEAVVELRGAKSGMPTAVATLRVTKRALAAPTVGVQMSNILVDYAGADPYVRVRFTDDGQIMATKGLSDPEYKLGDWYLPNTTGIGASYQITVFSRGMSADVDPVPNSTSVLTSGKIFAVDNFTGDVGSERHEFYEYLITQAGSTATSWFLGYGFSLALLARRLDDVYTYTMRINPNTGEGPALALSAWSVGSVAAIEAASGSPGWNSGDTTTSTAVRFDAGPLEIRQAVFGEARIALPRNHLLRAATLRNSGALYAWVPSVWDGGNPDENYLQTVSGIAVNADWTSDVRSVSRFDQAADPELTTGTNPYSVNPAWGAEFVRVGLAGSSYSGWMDWIDLHIDIKQSARVQISLNDTQADAYAAVKFRPDGGIETKVGQAGDWFLTDFWRFPLLAGAGASHMVNWMPSSVSAGLSLPNANGWVSLVSDVVFAIDLAGAAAETVAYASGQFSVSPSNQRAIDPAGHSISLYAETPAAPTGPVSVLISPWATPAVGPTVTPSAALVQVSDPENDGFQSNPQDMTDPNQAYYLIRNSTNRGYLHVDLALAANESVGRIRVFGGDTVSITVQAAAPAASIASTASVDYSQALGGSTYQWTTWHVIDEGATLATATHAGHGHLVISTAPGSTSATCWVDRIELEIVTLS